MPEKTWMSGKGERRPTLSLYPKNWTYCWTTASYTLVQGNQTVGVYISPTNDESIWEHFLKTGWGLPKTVTVEKSLNLPQMNLICWWIHCRLIIYYYLMGTIYQAENVNQCLLLWAFFSWFCLFWLSSR